MIEPFARRGFGGCDRAGSTRATESLISRAWRTPPLSSPAPWLRWSGLAGATPGRLPWGRVCGDFVGVVVGRVVGRVLYRTADGRTSVVRVGRDALPIALPAGITGGLASALAASSLAVALLAAPAGPAFIAAGCCGFLAGVVLFSLASLI